MKATKLPTRTARERLKDVQEMRAAVEEQKRQVVANFDHDLKPLKDSVKVIEAEIVEEESEILVDNLDALLVFTEHDADCEDADRDESKEFFGSTPDSCPRCILLFIKSYPHLAYEFEVEVEVRQRSR